MFKHLLKQTIFFTAIILGYNTRCALADDIKHSATALPTLTPKEEITPPSEQQNLDKDKPLSDDKGVFEDDDSDISGDDSQIDEE